MEGEIDLEFLSSLDYTPLLSPTTLSQQTILPNGTGTSILSPLSSPALPFKQQKRKESSSHSFQVTNSKRPKTPSATPLMTSINTNNIAQQQQEQQQQQTTSNITTTINNTTKSTSTASNELSNAFDFLPDIDLQLPPPPNLDPSTMINNNYKRHSSVLINPHHHKSATSSPVILPSSYPISLNSPNLPPGQGLTLGSNSHSNSNSNSNSVSASNNTGIVGTSILSRQNSRTSVGSSSTYQHQQSSSFINNGNKKMTHKLAEQGRRNRMNVAIQDLDKLIPENYKTDVLVPSKATTVELGCSYIRYLQQELEKLKK